MGMGDWPLLELESMNDFLGSNARNDDRGDACGFASFNICFNNRNSSRFCLKN